jgi:hypothetical protein
MVQVSFLADLFTMLTQGELSVWDESNTLYPIPIRTQNFERWDDILRGVCFVQHISNIKGEMVWNIS